MTPIYNIKIPKSNIDVWAKLESKNPTGSHKDRSMEHWISHYAKQGARDLAISSSGNSAISAAKYCGEKNIKLHIFVSHNTPKEKFESLIAYKNISLNITKTPNKDAFRFCAERGIQNLRASRDDIALEGYKDITLELIKQLPQIDNIFIPTSSGATLQGIYEAHAGGSTPRIKTPAIFAVQTAKVHPVAGYFDKDFLTEEISRATAIVDKVAHRRDQLIETIKQTGGGGFVISNKGLEEAKKALKDDAGLASLAGYSRAELGWHSALAFAGFLKWRAQNPARASKEISVCLFTD